MPAKAGITLEQPADLTVPQFIIMKIA